MKRNWATKILIRSLIWILNVSRLYKLIDPNFIFEETGISNEFRIQIVRSLETCNHLEIRSILKSNLHKIDKMVNRCIFFFHSTGCRTLVRLLIVSNSTCSFGILSNLISYNVLSFLGSPITASAWTSPTSVSWSNLTAVTLGVGKPTAVHTVWPDPGKPAVPGQTSGSWNQFLNTWSWLEVIITVGTLEVGRMEDSRNHGAGLMIL